MIDKDAVERPSRLSLVLTALSIGFALGAVLVSLYTFTRRVPDGLVSDRLGTATHFLGGSLVVVAVVAVALAGGGVAVLSGRAITGRAAVLLCLLTVVTAWNYLSDSPRTSTVAVSGSEGHPVVALVQASWLLLTASAALLVASTVIARDHHQLFKWQAALPFAAFGVVVSLVTAYGLATASRVGASHPTMASSIAIPEFPRTLGTKTAYTVTSDSIDELVPAGPGFVLDDESAVVAYNGATGAVRWRFPFTAFPDDCTFRHLRSTGTAPDAVVLAECVRMPEYGKYTDSFLVGLDAMTGQVLWSLDKGWSVQGRIQLPPDAVPVTSPDELGSLDPRTGELRWTRSLAELDQQCRATVNITMAVDDAIVHAAPCEASVRIHVLDAATGTDRIIEQPAAHPIDRARPPVEPIASYGTVAAVRLSYQMSYGHSDLVVDTRTSTVTEIPEDRLNLDYSAADVGQYPGPVVQLRPNTNIGDPTTLYRITDGTTIQASGLSVYTSGGTYGPRSGQTWAEVGNQLVTAAVDNRDSTRQLAVVSPDGTSTRRPSPCDDTDGGVVAVPGAVLIACLRFVNQSIVRYDLFGIPSA